MQSALAVPVHAAVAVNRYLRRRTPPLRSGSPKAVWAFDTMTILYSLVARGKTVLSEFTFTSGNFPTITRLLLAKIDCGRDGKVSYVYDQYVFHYLCDDGILYLCMCDDDQSQKRRIPFAFLEDLSLIHI